MRRHDDACQPLRCLIRAGHDRPEARRRGSCNRSARPAEGMAAGAGALGDLLPAGERGWDLATSGRGRQGKPSCQGQQAKHPQSCHRAPFLVADGRASSPRCARRTDQAMMRSSRMAAGDSRALRWPPNVPLPHVLSPMCRPPCAGPQLAASSLSAPSKPGRPTHISISFHPPAVTGVYRLFNPVRVGLGTGSLPRGGASVAPAAILEGTA